MKSMILVLKPEEAANLLNGDLSVLVRKKFPKEYVGWVYIYCTKDENKKLYFSTFHGKYMVAKYVDHKHKVVNGTVVARFWCNKVDSIWKTTTNIWTYGSDLEPNFYKESCLNDIELDRYFKPKEDGFSKVYGKAIHISKLEIFGKPKELGEFRRMVKEKHFFDCGEWEEEDLCSLYKAPTNYCYVEE